MKFRLTKKQQEHLRKLGVSTLYVFGSHAQGVAGPLSDYDFAVLLEDPTCVKFGVDKMDLYNALYDILTELIPSGRSEPAVVDIVFLQSGVSLELQANVVKHGQALFDENPRGRADYEAQVMTRMADMRPIMNMIDKAILERI